MPFDGSETGTFEVYRGQSKWKTLGLLILLMIGLVGMLVFLLRA